MISRIRKVDVNKATLRFKTICVIRFPSAKSVIKGNHRRKIMLTMVTKSFYNRVLTAESTIRSQMSQIRKDFADCEVQLTEFGSGINLSNPA